MDKILVENLDKAIKTIADLVAFDTTPDQPTAPLMKYIKKMLDELDIGYRDVTFDGGRHSILLARIGPDISGGCLFSGHVDVVSIDGQNWQTPPFQLTLAQDRLYGRGACDMKGFIGCILSLIPYWRTQKLGKPIYIALTYDEETSFLSIMDLIKIIDPQRKPKMAIIGEPTDMALVNAHKGAVEFTVNIQGRASHASRPDLGLNAINIAGELIGFIDRLQDDLRQDYSDKNFTPSYATACIGKISGGNAINTVAEHCCLRWNMRQIMNRQVAKTTASFDHFLADGISPTYAEAAISYEKNYMPALEAGGNDAALSILRKALDEPQIMSAPFVTEAGYYQSIGIETIVCGPGSIEQAHRADEYVEVAQIQKCLNFLQTVTSDAVLQMLD